MAHWSADPGDARHWVVVREDIADAALDVNEEDTAAGWDRLYRALDIERFLAERHLIIDTATRRRLALEAAKAVLDGTEVLERMAGGDYRPDTQMSHGFQHGSRRRWLGRFPRAP